MEAVNTILVIISGLCWSGVYILCIRGGFKEKTCCMPLFALGLNIAWEGIYAYLDLFINQTVTVQAIANACWFVLDILIVVTWFRYGQNRNAAAYEKKLFIPWTLLVLVVCFTLQLLFIKTFGQHDGEIYSAYLQNIVMSVSLHAQRSQEQPGPVDEHRGSEVYRDPCAYDTRNAGREYLHTCNGDHLLRV